MRRLSQRVQLLTDSATVVLSERAREIRQKGISVIDLASGDPDFATPPSVVDTACDALRSGFTHYVNSRGIPELVEAIAEKVQRENSLTLTDPRRQILVTPSAKFALAVALLTTLDPGDEVLVLTPGWVSYDACISIAGATPVHVPLRGDDGFRVSADVLRAHLTRRSKMILINTPNNPTGRVLSEEELGAVAQVAREANLLLLSDEIYERIVFDGRKHLSPASFPGMAERTLVVFGFSKTYAMTGWRLGYLVGPTTLLDSALKVQQHLVTCATSFVQRAGVTALRTADREVRAMVKEYQSRRDYVVRRLNECSLRCGVPEGTFYAFFDVSSTGLSSLEFSEWALEQAHVALTPGVAFGHAGEGFVRLAFTQPLPVLTEALDRLAQALRSIPG